MKNFWDGFEKQAVDIKRYMKALNSTIKDKGAMHAARKIEISEAKSFARKETERGLRHNKIRGQAGTSKDMESAMSKAWDNTLKGREKKAFMIGFKKQAGLISNAAMALSRGAGNVSKNLTTRALGATSTAGTAALGAGAHVAGLVAKHPKAAMGIAGAGAAGLATGAAMSGGNKGR